MLTVGSLFSGIGGIELGLERTGGFRVIWQCENEPYASRVLAKHWPHVPNLGDIRHVNWTAIERPDLVCGGFPCTDISSAGKRAGIHGEHSSLWFEFVRCLGVVRPDLVLVENVAALLHRGMGDVLGQLSALGYDAEWDCLPAAAFGAPYRRDRVFVVARVDGDRCNQSRLSIREASSFATSRVRSQDVASTNGGRRGTHERHVHAREPDSTGRAADDADADRQGELQHKKPLFGIGNGPGDCGWWLTEPAVDRVVSRVPFELDCVGGRLNGQQSNASEKDAKRIRSYSIYRFLRSVWEQKSLATSSPRLFKERVLAAVPAMSHGRSHDGWVVGSRIEKNEELRDLWEEFYAQPFEEAQDLQQRLLERIGKEKRPQAMAARVDRIRCLGLSVVPQVAEYIGERIIESMKGSE